MLVVRGCDLNESLSCKWDLHCETQSNVDTELCFLGVFFNQRQLWQDTCSSQMREAGHFTNSPPFYSFSMNTMISNSLTGCNQHTHTPSMLHLLPCLQERNQTCHIFCRVQMSAEQQIDNKALKVRLCVSQKLTISLRCNIVLGSWI